MMQDEDQEDTRRGMQMLVFALLYCIIVFSFVIWSVYDG